MLLGHLPRLYVLDRRVGRDIGVPAGTLIFDAIRQVLGEVV